MWNGDDPLPRSPERRYLFSYGLSVILSFSSLLKNINIFLLLLIIFVLKRNVLTSTFRLLDMCVCVCSIVYTYI